MQNGVPLESILRPLFISISIYGTISKFAGDTGFDGVVNCEQDSNKLQRDLDRQMKYMGRWQIEFNAEKFEAFHLTLLFPPTS